MKTLSLDLRERVVACYDAGKGTRREVADRFRVSLAMVKKLLQQRRRTGDLGPRHRFSGRKPLILEEHRRRMRQVLGQHPDMTLSELRGAVGLACSLPAIHYALARMQLTYKKRHSVPASKSVRM
jgi:transposase